MVSEKINALKKDVYNDSLDLKLNEIKDSMNTMELVNTQSYNFKYLVNNIKNYFYDLSSSIFDTFVCECAKKDENCEYKNFKLFYLNIFYSYLREFFIDSKVISEFFKKIPELEYRRIFCICEDSLFNFISIYYFNADESVKERVEHILRNMMIYDSNDEEKIKRYKKIMFTHYKGTECEKMNKNIKRYIENSKTISREYTSTKKQLKELRGVYINFKSVEEKLGSYTRDDILKNLIPNTKNYLYDLNKSYKDNEEKIKLEKMKLSKMEKLTQEEFERG